MRHGFYDSHMPDQGHPTNRDVPAGRLVILALSCVACAHHRALQLEPTTKTQSRPTVSLGTVQATASSRGPGPSGSKAELDAFVARLRAACPQYAVP